MNPQPTVIGQRRDGRPIYLVAGGSEPAVEIPPAPPAPGTITVPVPPPPPPAPAPVATLPAEEIERIRREAAAGVEEQLAAERARREAIEAQVAELSTERAQRLEQERQRSEAETAAAEEKRRNEQSFKEALDEATGQFGQQIQSLQEQIASRDALLAKEREFHDLMEYRAQRLRDESENIMPTLVEFVTGNTQAEIDAAIEKVKTKTAETVNAMQQAGVAARIAQPGASVTGAPAAGGPMDQLSATRTYTPDELRDMPMSDYIAQRRQLLGAASESYRGKGMFD